jgi:hypothetical protein
MQSCRFYPLLSAPPLSPGLGGLAPLFSLLMMTRSKRRGRRERKSEQNRRKKRRKTEMAKQHGQIVKIREKKKSELTH